jgi:glycosyltransferase involved in cell wall biosynthesis
MSVPEAPDCRPKLILLTQWFDPEPTFKGLIFARALYARGYDVEVVTGFPNYPGGKLYQGYKLRPIRRETHDNVQVTRLALFPSHGQSGLGRAFNYLSFMISAFFYLLFGARKADLMYIYHPPITVGFAGALAGFFRRTPFIIDIQDMWPDTLAATGMVRSSAILSLVGHLCRWVYDRASHIVVLSSGFASLLQVRGVPSEKVTVIYNWADEAAIGSSAKCPEGMLAPGRFQILFAGNMGRAQALDTPLEAARIVADHGAPIDFVFLGDGLECDRLKLRAAQEGIGNVRFLPKVPMQDVGAYLQAADVLLVCLRDDPLFKITVPSKTQAYMAAGRPILISVGGDASLLVEEAACGAACPPEDAVGLAKVAMELCACGSGKLALMGEAGRRFYDRKLSLDAGVDAFHAVFARVIVRRKRQSA